MMIKKMIYALAGALVLVSLANAAGTTANLSWVLPTTYVDGTAVAATDIASVSVCWSPPAGGGPKAGCVTKTGSVTSATVPVACGSENFTVAVTTSTTAVYPNSTSDPSNAVPYASGVVCKPNPPTSLSAQ